MENDIFPSLFTKHYAASARLRSVLVQRSAVQYIHVVHYTRGSMDALCMGLRTSSVIGFKNKQASCKQTNMHNQYVIQYPMLIGF